MVVNAFLALLVGISQTVPAVLFKMGLILFSSLIYFFLNGQGMVCCSRSFWCLMTGMCPMPPGRWFFGSGGFPATPGRLTHPGRERAM